MIQGSTLSQVDNEEREVIERINLEEAGGRLKTKRGRRGGTIELDHNRLSFKAKCLFHFSVFPPTKRDEFSNCQSLDWPTTKIRLSISLMRK